MNHSLASAGSTASSSPPRSSIATSTSEGRRQHRPKDTQFVYKYGRKLHALSQEKAPYPLSYDQEVLEQEHLDTRLIKYLRQGSVSFIDFPSSGLPERCLDLGCGTGSWIIEAAKDWTNCSFVGFDLVNVQIPLKLLDSSLEERIQWKYGNFLTTKLPFDDDEFDHVHIQSISLGVPENKWGVLFDEICRVLRPGGSVEMVEDDIVFPVLPRWFTAPMRARPHRSASVHLPEGYGNLPSPPETPTPMTSHDHALLESLHKSVFEHRFINRKPSAVLPSYFTTYFRHCTLGPILSFPMPPISPLQPLPPQMATAYAVGPLGLDLDQRASIMAATSMSSSVSSTAVQSTAIRPISLSFSSAVSKESSTSTTSGSSQGSKEISPRFSLEVSEALAIDDTDSQSEILPPPLKDRYLLDSTGLANNTLPRVPLVDPKQLDSLNERSLAMHLYRSYNLVLGCQEALWEELKDRVRNRKHELEPFGWEDEEEFEEVQNRKKFERLLERYRSDMQSRVSLWCSLSDIGWPLPVREPLTKAELIEEERMREAMLEARRSASLEDQQLPCRSVRVLVGFKPS
ncbi:hypothetical protein BDP27DRAFT_1316051 [Rhodocollybia butyracea]|uniref:Methyltransferase domain-containing protein n=1 Tax=Rhodocollybia butyracea TaxID=206335 RepID=A0A9P5UC64_9AGAR|nr:hypothetical protein BDP27DRAFT_1316051 [Rhodocollybia butyracea]